MVTGLSERMIEGVAVRRAAHQVFDADRRIGARLVFHDHALSDGLLQVFAMTRAVRSMLPPGAWATIIRIVRFGNVSACAAAAMAPAVSKTNRQRLHVKQIHHEIFNDPLQLDPGLLHDLFPAWNFLA